jgi:predicted O-methyltransferase YrrM
MHTIDIENQELTPQEVGGWLKDTEGRALFGLAKKCTGRGVIVEIGSWKGKSTIWLGRGSRLGRGVQIHAIDPHTGSPQHREALGEVWTFDEFKQNIKRAKIDDLVVPHVDFSDAVARTFDEKVELIFIDGLHEYEGVKIDFDMWFPKVVDGGWIAFHDSTCWDGVRKVVTDELFKSGHFRHMRFTASIAYGQKVASTTALERVGNRFMMWAFLTHAFIERSIWRLVHNYLDFPLARALRLRLKGKRAVQPQVGV